MVALLHGWDPIAYLDLTGVEARVAREVLQQAEDVANDRRKALIKAVEVAIQNGVAKAFGAKK